ncbi:hybrid signal transduction histidine kinase M [Tanacetum coccineum]
MQAAAVMAGDSREVDGPGADQGRIHYDNFGVLKHIEGESDDESSSDPPPPTDEWKTADSIVKSWIFLTLAPTLQGRLIKINPKTAKDAWEQVEKIFLGNKCTRTIALKGELRVIQMGDFTADAYFRKIESIVTLLNDLGSSMTDDDVVTYAINGLSEKYAQLATIIAHKDPFPDLDTMRSMVITEEMRLNSRSQPVSINTSSTTPQVLLTETPQANHANRNQDSRTSRDTRTNTPQVCRNFSCGFCRCGNAYRFLHDAARSQNSTRQLNVNRIPSVNNLGGLNNNFIGQPNLATNFGLGSIPPGFGPQQGNTTFGHSVTNQGNTTLSPQQQALLTHAVYGSGNQSTPHGQETFLPQAFNTMTLQEPANANWNMDTGASSHLNSSATNLSNVFNSCIYPSVFVGDGNFSITSEKIT